MALTKVWRYTPAAIQDHTGLSTDPKPESNVPAQSTFLETNTGNVFVYDGSSWKKVRVDKPTVGAAVGDLQSIANGATLSIRPPEGETWFVEFLGFSGAVTIELTDGTNATNISTETEKSSLEKCEYRITHDIYITMANSSGGALIYSYLGYKVNENL